VSGEEHFLLICAIGPGARRKVALSWKIGSPVGLKEFTKEEKGSSDVEEKSE
jgi:hypothetical protein